MQHSGKYFLTFVNPPMSKGSREVANLTERKNPHTPVCGVKEFVRLSSVYLSSNQNQKHFKKSLQLWLPELFL